MAITDAPRPLALPTGGSQPQPKPLGVFTRPRATTGWRSWVTTVDHKKIAKMYGACALVFFVVGGCEALLIRLQLATPNGKLLSADLYNQVFTMHGTTMIFLVVMPIGTAFMNYLIPMQIGARDVAFPRLNAFGFWSFLFGGLLLNSSWVLGGAPDNGWYNYAPNSGVVFSPTHGIDFWTIGLLITGIASLTGAVNLIVTVLNMRAPGMTWMKIPIFTWMALVTQFMLLFAIPVLTAAQFLLLFDRRFGANFFKVQQGADPLLWEHLFWIFGHPEVYIMILPAFGAASEMIPVFSRKPLFGYPVMVISGIAIGFLGWGVWAHHMFTSGMGPWSVAAFSVGSMTIAVPTGVKIFNWMATMWRGKLRFTTSMLFSVGMVTMFTIGGLSGVTHAVAPADTQQHDTYYIVAHFHYVLFGGAFLAFMGAFYFWWPKAFGHHLNEKLGKVNFWVMLVGFNLTFGPQHILGLQGMPRRVYTYKPNYGFDLWNMVSTIGSFILAFSVLLFIINILYSRHEAHKPGAIPAGNDPWDARSVEWISTSPPPAHNFDVVPEITELDELWHRKYAEDERGRLVRVARTEDVVDKGVATNVHMPAPSYWPLVVAFGLVIVGYGMIFSLVMAAVGGFILFVGVYGWALEPSDDEDLMNSHGHGHGGPAGPAPVEPLEASVV
jgi:cytochrome c oxidase subunit 1